MKHTKICEALDPEFKPTSYDEKWAHSLSLKNHLYKNNLKWVFQPKHRNSEHRIIGYSSKYQH